MIWKDKVEASYHILEGEHEADIALLCIVFDECLADKIVALLKDETKEKNNG